MLTVSQVCKQVPLISGPLTILDDINFNVEKGQSLAIIGASGAGKSNLLSILAGLDLPSTGQVIIAGQTITELDEDERAVFRAGHVGFVFQSFHLLPTLTALENVALPLELKYHHSALDTAKSLLDKVGLGERTAHYPNQMSGGEQQRVAIARAFAAQPEILFADEPTGNLDSKTGEKIADLLFELNRENHTTLIVVTHDIKLASRCDRIIELAAGKVLQEQKVATGTA